MSAIAGLVLDTTIAARHYAPDASEAVTLRRVEGRRWDEVAAGFDGVCQEQLHAFAAIRWPGVTLEAQLAERDGRIVGGALMMVQQLPLGLGNIAISKWAPMLADAQAADRQAIYAGMVEGLMAEYGRKRGMMLSILPHASVAPVNAEYLALRARGFRRGSPLRYPYRYLVNLQLSDAAQRQSFQQTWRRQLNKAEKSALSFEHGGVERLDEFKALYEAMSDRKQFPDHSAYDTLDVLMAMDQRLRPELFFVRHAGAIVAGALIFKAGERAVYLYGATNDQALPLRAGYFLHWHIIRWLRDNTRARWYDLGGTDGFLGLHRFKKGMVGDAGLMHPVPPVVNYAAHPLAFWLGSAAFAARDAVNGFKHRIDLLRPGRARPDQPLPELDDYLK
ncbi:GNAT family N-acetyltransferase [Devosia sp. YIM 151766]|uniref:lipid II:glycine glycyltransferase FemX n=1 Tax=Devosia sp. YIM 151766 TaxID=3017325 RepID=UPI00255D0215|nr:peptidoglycan bridge formation glycyltransferase FemA/FemB family protein [Devosia sp. YIM 151766]WIY51680.1 GNAT family N-acetyltransferase [Devosia sp. YIM 151766]